MTQSDGAFRSDRIVFERRCIPLLSTPGNPCVPPSLSPFHKRLPHLIGHVLGGCEPPSLDGPEGCHLHLTTGTGKLLRRRQGHRCCTTEVSRKKSSQDHSADRIMLFNYSLRHTCTCMRAEMPNLGEKRVRPTD